MGRHPIVIGVPFLILGKNKYPRWQMGNRLREILITALRQNRLEMR